jgi:hypothetical protein
MPSASPLVDTGRAPATTYLYQASAVDSAGNVSPLSGIASATTNASADTTAPTVPNGIAASTVSATTLRIVWLPSTDSGTGVAGYRIERSADGSTGWAEIGQPTSTTYDDTGLSANTRRYYRVRAVDVAGNLSGYSLTVNAITSAGSGSFDFFIGPNGSDSNPGTQSQPWAITALNTKAATYAGKRVGLLDGTYLLYDMALPNIYYENALLNIAGGSSGSPTVVQAVNARQAILDGSEDGAGTVFLNGGSQGGGALIGGVGSDRSHITLKDIVVRNHFGAAVLFAHTASSGHSESSKTTGIVVEGCEFHNTNGITGSIIGTNVAPVVFFHTSNAAIRWCYIHDTYGETLSQPDHNSGILWWDVHDSVIEYCTFKRGPNPIHLKGAANARATIRYNYLEMDPARSDTCIRSDEGQAGGASYIHNNVMIGITAISWSTSPFKTAETHIFNNTFVGTTQSGVAHHQASSSSKWLRFYNNIIYGVTSSIPGGDLEFSADTWAVLNHNCYSTIGFKGRAYTPGSTSAYAEFASLSLWRTRVQSSLAGAESASLQANPLFVGTGTDANAYKLQAGSPCIGAGIGGVTMGAWGGAVAPTQLGSE